MTPVPPPRRPPASRPGARRSRTFTACLALAVITPASAHAQLAVAPAPTAGRVQPLLRVDLIDARGTSLQLGVGGGVISGPYVRVEAGVAGGAIWYDGATRGAGRGDVVARFLLDPFREFPVGLYGVGGASVMVDPFEDWRARLIVGVGVEGRPRNGRVAALEVALGGGLRVGVVMRRERPGRR